MAIDQNVYSLAISLALESTDAFETLNEFGETATNIEKRISDTAQKTINSISGVVNTLNQGLMDTAGATKNVKLSGVELETVLSKATDAIRESYKIQGDNLNDIEERLDFLEKIEDVQEKLEKSLKAEHKTGQEYLKLIDQWVSALESKNIVHDEEKSLLQQEGKEVSGLHSGFSDIEDKVGESVLHHINIYNTLKQTFALILKFDEATEKFVQTNYRAYSSQQQLVNSTRQLSSELGIARDISLNAYKALADVKTPLEEIDKLARVISIANRTTGVAEEQLAGYIRSLRIMGFDAEKTKKQIEFMTEAMRKYGLSQNDVNSLMQRSGVEAIRFKRLFGGIPEEVAKMEQARINLAGFGKELGITADSANKFFDWLSSDIGAMERFGQLTGSQIKNAEDFKRAQIKSGLAIVNRLELLQKQDAIIGNDNATKAYVKATTEAYFAMNDGAFEATKALGLHAKQLNITGDAVGDYAKLVGSLAGRQLDQWSEANNTLTGQFIIFKNIIMGTLGPAVQWLADGLKVIFKIFNAIITPIAWVITKFISLVDWVEANIPILGYFVTALKVVITGLIFATAVIAVAVIAWWKYSTAMATASAATASMASATRTVGSTIVSIASAIGNSIRVIFVAIGQGLAALGTSIQPVIIPLMQLGLVVLSVGGGFFLMGLGLYLAAQNGWAAIGMLIAMTTAMAAIITVFAVLAVITGPIIPLIYSLSIVMLILGASAALVGVGMYFIGLSIQSLATYGATAAFILPALAAGVILLGIAGFFGFEGIMLLAAALAVLGVALWLVASASAVLTTAFEKLSGDAISEFADALIASTWKITVAMIALIPALFILPFVAIAIFAAGAILIVAGALFVVASTLIGAGAMLLGKGLKSLAPGVKAFEDIDFVGMAYQLLVGGLLLVAGGIPFIIGATLIGIGALLLGYGLQSLGPGAKALEGVDFVGMAGQLMEGGLLLAAGGIPFIIGATLIGVAALILGAGLLMLGTGAQTLKNIDFVDMAYQLAVGGLLLTAGAIFFVAGATLVGVAALALGVGLLMLGTGAQTLKDIDFVDMAERLYLSGKHLIKAGRTLIPGAAAVAYASFYIGIAGIAISAVGSMLKSGAAKIKIGTDDLYSSGDKLLWSGRTMLEVGPMLSDGSYKLYWASVVLIGASGKLAIAGRAIYPAAVAIKKGMWWLDDAILKFSKSVWTIDKIGKAMYLFANSFIVLKDAPIDSLGKAAHKTLLAIPTIDRAAKQLDRSAGIFQKSTDKFIKPAREMISVLGELGTAISDIGGQGFAVQADIDKLGVMLDKYTLLLENSAVRIEAAVVSKAVPAMISAEKSGITDVIRSEAITTVQVMDKTEGEVSMLDDGLLLEQVALLRGINDKLDGMQEGSKTGVPTIVELLETYLPDFKTSKSGLSNELNQWTK